jgi:hypothetical protein
MTSGLIPDGGGDSPIGEGELEGFQSWTPEEDSNG